MSFYELPELPYKYDALEPFIDAETLYIHHDKLHRNYVNKLNKTLDGYEWFVKDKSINKILSDIPSIPAPIREDVIKYGGGYSNHNLYFESLTPNETKPSPSLEKEINNTFGSLDNLILNLKAALNGIFGSGWVFLVLNENNQLEIIQTKDQFTPLSINKLPILTLDMWEHAYFLQYKNLRSRYVDNIFNIINWDEVSKKYEDYKNRNRY